MYFRDRGCVQTLLTLYVYAAGNVCSKFGFSALFVCLFVFELRDRTGQTDIPTD